MKQGDTLKSNYDGDFEVIEVSAKRCKIKFLSTGFTTEAPRQEAKKGKVKDKIKPRVYGVGFVGVGEFKLSTNGRKTKAGSVWYGILSRCYNENDAAYKTYGAKGVFVCSEWHNFQNFAKWFEDNFIESIVRPELDKDILSEEVKKYSPQTCMFVTKSENITEANSRTFTISDPKGRIVTGRNVKELCSDNDLNYSCIMDVLHGRHKTHKGWRLPNEN